MSGEWYKDAIFYEVFGRRFFDSDGDGIGDFRSLKKNKAADKLVRGFVSSLGLQAPDYRGALA